MQSIIAKYGSIVDFKMFSDLEMSLKLEVQENKVCILYLQLTSFLTMENFPMFKSQSSIERTVFLNVSFIKGKGNLKIEVPSIPG